MSEQTKSDGQDKVVHVSGVSTELESTTLVPGMVSTALTQHVSARGTSDQLAERPAAHDADQGRGWSKEDGRVGEDALSWSDLSRGEHTSP